MNNLIFFLLGTASGFLGSVFAYLFSDNLGRLLTQLRKWTKDRLIRTFWQQSQKRVYVYYPVYHVPKVGRAQRRSSTYYSEEDVDALNTIADTLKTHVYVKDTKDNIIIKGDDTGVDFDNLQLEVGRQRGRATIVLVCGPKIDPDTGYVVDDSLIGGNAVSNDFYRQYGQKLGMKLEYNKNLDRKEWKFPRCKELVVSPMDEGREQRCDIGLLGRYEDGALTFIFCWGIHSYGTIGAARASLDRKLLSKIKKKVDFERENCIALIRARYNDRREIENVEVEDAWIPIPLIPTPKRPDPYTPGNWIPDGKPPYGLGYLWATEKNIDAASNRRYDQIRPVAAELDLSLECPYKCPWCVYRKAKINAVSQGKALTLHESNTAEAIVKKLDEWGIRLLVLTGGGEPLMSPCVEGIVSEWSKKGKLLTLYTNGVKLDGLRAFGLMWEGIGEIRVTLDDVSSKENFSKAHGLDSRTGEEYFHTVEKNLRTLLDLREKNGFKARIGASFVVSDQTFDNLDRSLARLTDWLSNVSPLDYIVFRPAINYWPEAGEGQFITEPEDKAKKIDDIRKKPMYNQVARKMLISWQRFEAVGKRPLDDAYPTCLASNLWLNIGPDASAYLCCETKHLNNWFLGNILRDDLSTLLSQHVIKNKRVHPPGASGCPTRLCKPSAQNILFHLIEVERENPTGNTEEFKRWLKEMEKEGKSAPSGTFMPSVSGQYEGL